MTENAKSNQKGQILRMKTIFSDSMIKAKSFNKANNSKVSIKYYIYDITNLWCRMNGEAQAFNFDHHSGKFAKKRLNFRPI